MRLRLADPPARIQARSRLFAVGLFTLSSLVCSACTPSSKAYLGPTLKSEEVGIVVPPEEVGPGGTSIAILQINGQSELGEWSGGSAVKVYLLPGEYQFRVEFKQQSGATLVPILDLILLIQAAAAAAEHEETEITFPVKAGWTHRLHYDTSSHVYHVSLFPGAARVHSMEPKEDAVPCVEDADRSADFWCQLVPPPASVAP